MMSNGFNLKRSPSVTVAVRLVVVSIIFFTATPAVQANLISKPINTFVQVGHSTELSCRTDLTESVTWMQRKPTDGRTHVLYTTHVLYDYKGRKNSDRMNVTRGSVQGGWYNLTIKNVSYNEAGVYTCVDDDNVEGAERHNVELVVIDASGLQCVHNLDICGQYPPMNTVNITCSLRYYGNTQPILLWKKNGIVINDTISFQFGNATMVPSFTGLSLAMRPGQLISSSLLSCEIVDGTNYLQSAPSQAFRQSLAFIFEKYGDTACLLVNQDKCTMEPTNHKCSRGSYYWPNINNALMFNVNVREINEKDGPCDQVYYCPEGRITCSAEIYHVATTMSYYGPGATPTSHATTVTAIVIPILLVLIGSITVAVLVRKARRRETAETRTEENELVEVAVSDDLATAEQNGLMNTRETTDPSHSGPNTELVPSDFQEHAHQSNCMSKPFFDQSSLKVHKVPGNRPVSGLTVVGNKLFVVRSGFFLQVEEYNSCNPATANPVLLLPTNGQTFHCLGLAACSHYNCLYVIGREQTKTFVIHRVALSDKSVERWSHEIEGNWWGLSVTNDFNLLITNERPVLKEYITSGESTREVRNETKIMFFTTDGIKLEKEVMLPFEDLCIINDCVQQANDNFVICCCRSSLHQVCISNRWGGILGEYGKIPGSGDNELNGPCNVSVDKYDNVFVADKNNHRIVLLSPMLIHQSYIQTSIHGLSYPCVLHFDKNNCRLYIGQGDGTIFAVYQAEDKGEKSVRNCTSESLLSQSALVGERD